MKHYLHKFQNQTAYDTAKAGANFYKPAVSLIESDKSIIYDPYISPAPPEMIDLGLTSGTLWAANNIGAEPGSTPESYYGGYYAWGEIKTKNDYSWNTWGSCKYTLSFDKVTKYCPTSKSSYWGGEGSPDNKYVLDPMDDIITLTYGESYSIPREEDLQELIDETDTEWIISYNDIQNLNGCKFSSKSDPSKFIFIPAAGYFISDISSPASGIGNIVNIISSSIYDYSPSSCRALTANDNSIKLVSLYRIYGSPIRAIQKLS